MSGDTPTNNTAGHVEASAPAQAEDSAVELEPLTPEEELFVTYLFEENMNRTRAYMRLYPKATYYSSSSSASRLLAKTKIMTEVARRLGERRNVASVTRSIKLCRDGSGYIYLITSDSGYTKIGHTQDVRKRFLQIDTSNPSCLTIYHSCWVNQARDLESILHKKFTHLRIKGEWFKLSNEDLVKAVSMIDSHERAP